MNWVRNLIITVIISIAMTSVVSAQYIGDIDTVGTTWCDMQHNGSSGRMICLDDLGNINVCWMNGLQAGAANRHIYYNLRWLGLGWIWESEGAPI